MTDRRAAVLEINGLSKTFPGQRALDDVDLEVLVGEIHALIGQNGSGKSTLVKVLAGYHRPDPGVTAALRGAAFAIGSASAAKAAGIRFVHQDLGLVEALSVADNFHLAEESGRPITRIRRRSERAATRTALSNLGYDLDPDALVDSERTAVAVARALSDLDDGPALLVLDEVTASLPGPEVARLFAALRLVAARGVAILFISHHLDEVMGLADRVTVLRDGRRITTATVGETSHDGLVELLLGRQLLADATRPSDDERSGDRALTVRALAGAVVTGLDLDVESGEVVGVAGLTGSGREEVAGLLAGRLPRTGQVWVSGRTVPSAEPKLAIDLGMCLVPADRAAHALLPAISVRENMTLPDVRAFWSGGVLHRTPERTEVRHWISELDLRPDRPEVAVNTLSGGNQQKVVMARWLRVEPKVLVLDEPTQGVDVGSKADIHRLVDRAAAGGAAVVICSTDSDELARLCHRVVVLQRGQVAGELTGAAISVERIERMQLAIAAELDTGQRPPPPRRPEKEQS
jgi:ribose transport system ATP-binding protein